MPILYYIASLVLAVTLLSNATLVTEGERALSRMETPEEKTDTLVKGWMESLSFGLYTGASDKAQVREEVATAAGYHRERVLFGSLGLALLSAGFLGWLALAARHHGPGTRRRLTLHLHGVAAICLLVGLSAPMLTVVAQREVAVLGSVVLQFETKSIFGTVGHLFSGGSLFVATLLLVFSVLVPLAKLLVSLIALLARSADARHTCGRLLRAIGKWSMTDVFVVAILLSFLAAGSGGLTDARLGPGLYFFAAYGLLSLVGSILLTHQQAAEPPVLPPVEAA